MENRGNDCHHLLPRSLVETEVRESLNKLVKLLAVVDMRHSYFPAGGQNLVLRGRVELELRKLLPAAGKLVQHVKIPLSLGWIHDARLFQQVVYGG